MILEEIKEILEKNPTRKEESYWKDILGINIKKGHASEQYCCFLFMNSWFEKEVIRSNTKNNVFCYKYIKEKNKDKGDYLITKVENGVFVGLKPEDIDDIKALLEDIDVAK